MTDLMLVCRAFKFAIEGDPQMWAVVTRGPGGIQNGDRIARALTLSRAVPLAIDLDHVEAIRVPLPSLATLLHAQSHRWREIRVPDSLWVNMPKTRWDLPTTESLELFIDPSAQLTAQDRTFAAPNAPRLRRLALEGVNMTGSLPPFAAQSLSLCHITSQAIDAEAIIQVLAISPMLERLDLRGFNETRIPNAAIQPRPPSLSLTHLCLRSNATFTIAIIGQLHAPNLETLEIDLPGPHNATQTRAIEHLFSTHPRGLFSTVAGKAWSAVFCNVTDSALVFSGTTMEGLIHVSIGVEPEDLPDDFIQMLFRPAQPDLVLTYDGGHCDRILSAGQAQINWVHIRTGSSDDLLRVGELKSEKRRIRFYATSDTDREHLREVRRRAVFWRISVVRPPGDGFDDDDWTADEESEGSLDDWQYE